MRESNQNTIDNNKTHFVTSNGDKVNELLFLTNCASALRIHCFLISYQLLIFHLPITDYPQLSQNTCVL